MSRFKDAFGKGIAAHESAERAMTEIQDVLKSFAGDVVDASGGAVQIYRADKDFFGALSRKLIFTIGPKSKLPPIEPYNSLVAAAVLPEGVHVPDSEFRLADYNLSAAGYPVSVSYSDVVVQCHDRASLEAALEAMLEHPDTGGKVLHLMRISRQHSGGRTAIDADVKEGKDDHADASEEPPKQVDE